MMRTSYTQGGVKNDNDTIPEGRKMSSHQSEQVENEILVRRLYRKEIRQFQKAGQKWRGRRNLLKGWKKS